jgi:hypothetical protein
MKIMLNHSSAKQYEETPHINKSTKNKTLNLNGRATERKETPHANKGTKKKTLTSNDTGTGREETPYANKSTKHKTVSKTGTSKMRSVPPRSSGWVIRTVDNALKQRNGTSGAGKGAGSSSRKTKISNALRRRAQAIINDKSIDAESRAIIRYGLEVNDPLLPELVRRVDAGEAIIETIVLLKHP